MPGLNNGNLCWGNRIPFSMFGAEYNHAFPSMDMMMTNGEWRRGIAACSISRIDYVQTFMNPPSENNDDCMDTSDDILSKNITPGCHGVSPGTGFTSRKRQASDLNSDLVKRLRNQEPSHVEAFVQCEKTTSQLRSHNLGHCLV